MAFIQDPSQKGGKAFNLGYELGFFVGENLILIIAFIVVVLLLILFFRRKSNRNIIR